MRTTAPPRPPGVEAIAPATSEENQTFRPARETLRFPS
jgi:hypothetical protein